MSKIEVRTSPQHGRGVFATARIAKGTPILRFTGPRLHRDALDPNDYHLQIDEQDYLGPSGREDDYVNHCCEPNAAFTGDLDLVALRDIEAGEEITWDYSTAIDEAGFAGFPCACGAPGCRGRVRSFRDLPEETRRRLRPWLIPYLEAKYFSTP